MTLRSKAGVTLAVFMALVLTSLALALSYTSACRPPPTLAGNTETMKAIVYRCYGSTDVLKFEDVEKPTVGDDELLVKVHAAAVNPLDWHYMRGSPYPMRAMSGFGAPTDTRFGVDFAGTVAAVGKAVQRFKPGDEVFGGAAGAFAEYLTIRENRALALKPANVTFEQAASTPIAAITALQAVRDIGQVQPGHKVLINGASGGVGTFAVQIAKALGAEVTGICSTRNLEMVQSIGADHVIDYTRQDYTDSDERYNLIIDNVGNHGLLANRNLLQPEGTLVIVGGPKGDWFGPLMSSIQAPLISPFVDQNLVSILAELNHEDMAVLGNLMRDGKVRPVIDRRYALRDVPAAIAYSEEGHARGKIIIEIAQE